jgi:hypothetical protein
MVKIKIIHQVNFILIDNESPQKESNKTNNYNAHVACMQIVHKSIYKNNNNNNKIT